MAGSPGFSVVLIYPVCILKCLSESHNMTAITDEENIMWMFSVGLELVFLFLLNDLPTCNLFGMVVEPNCTIQQSPSSYTLWFLSAVSSWILQDLAVWKTCLLRRNVFRHCKLNGTVAMLGSLCACIISLVMNHQINISLCLKLIEKKDMSFWSLLVIPPPFCLPLIVLSLILSSPVSILSPPETGWGSTYISLETNVLFPHWLH